MKKHTLAILITLVVPTLAFAQTAQQPPANRPGAGVMGFAFQQYDANGDGVVTRAEFDAFRRQRFDDTDENGDGWVSEDEYVDEFAMRQQRSVDEARAAEVEQTHNRFNALDRDKDGFISRAEYDASGNRAFEQYTSSSAEPPRQRMQSGGLNMPSTHTRTGMATLYDTDGDGVVSRAEFDTGRGEAFARTDEGGDGRLSLEEYLTEYEARLDRQVASRRDGADDQSRVRFGVLDTDKDGRMTWEEYAASGNRMFERADTNGDGVVDASDPAPARMQRPADAPGDASPAHPSTPANSAH